MLIFHDPQCASYQRIGHPEAPFRVRDTAALLQKECPGWEWIVPELASGEDLLRAHSAKHLRHLQQADGDFDADTPNYKDIYRHALRAAGGAVAAARAALAGKRSFVLLRPPGHHACRERAMGFCYLNSAAVAALAARAAGVERVAVWDFDAHHGNGTEEILLGTQGCLYSSVHEYPGYPGTGTKIRDNAWNWTVAPHGSRKEHMEKLEQSWQKVLDFKPGLVVISAGFDAYKDDPITQMNLEAEDFAVLGRWVRQSGLPAASVLEGGYSKQLPELVRVYLEALE
jgi:acetoin utilization deacetylase AcuC-like enzyme